MFIEAGADLARILELAARNVMHAEEQRAEAGARAAGSGVAGDDEILALAAFQLDPRLGAPRHVRRIGELADQSLEAELAGLVEHLVRLAFQVLAQPHAGIFLQRARQPALALFERQRAQILAGEEGRVEHEEHDLGSAPGFESVLQRLEARATAFVQHHDLAIEPGLVELQRLEAAREVRQALGPVLAAAREDARVALGEPGEHAIAVVLHLVEPMAGVRRLGDECRELRRDESRQLDFLPPVLRERALRARVLALHALGTLGGDVVVVPHRWVVALDQEPRRPILVAAGAREDPGAVQLFTVEPEVKPSFAQRGEWIGVLGRPDALVPEQHFARAVLLLRDHAFELAVLERMVLGLHGEPFVARIEARAFRYRPALQNAFQLEPEVVMQPRRRVPLNVIAQRLGFFPRSAPARLFPRGFRRDREIAHLTVALEPIGHVAAPSKARARAVIATAGTQVLQQIRFFATAAHRWHGLCSVTPENERTNMGPAIALRLRQHLTLTPQVQQALKLLQMSAMEFAQEMEQALAANP